MMSQASFKGILTLSCLSILIIQSQCGDNTTTKPLSLTSQDSLDKGMQPLYTMVEVFLGDVVQAKKLNESSIDISLLAKNSGEFLKQLDWKIWVQHYVGYAVCAAIGLVFILVMPFVALIFCCCRLCGKCGGKHEDYDPPRAGCKRCCYFTFIMILATLVLAGVVCAFVTLTLAHQRFNANDNSNPFRQVSASVDGYNNYLKGVNTDLHDGVLEGYKTFVDKLLDDTNNSIIHEIDEIMDQVNATTTFDKAEALGRDVGKTITILERLNASLVNLTTLTQRLDTELSSLQADSLHGLNQCKKLTGFKAPCNAEYIRVSALKVSVNFSVLERMESLQDNIRKVKDVKDEIQKGREKFEMLKQNSSITEGITETIQSVRNESGKVEKKIMNELENVNTVLNNITLKGTKGTVNDMDDVVKKSSKFWYYPLIALCGVMALIVVLNYLGLLFGICGGRPSTGSNACCSRGVAANIFMAGVAIFLIFCVLFMLIVTLLFIPGGLIFTEVCRYTTDHNPYSLKVYSDSLNISKLAGRSFKSDKSLTEILQSCKENEGIYQALDLEKTYNISSAVEMKSVRKQIDDMNIDTSKFTVSIPNEMKTQLEEFGKAGFQSFNAAEYRKELKKNLTSGDLKEIANSLDELAGQVKITNPSLATNFTNIANRMRDVDRTTIRDMKLLTTTLNDTVNELEGRTDYKNKVDKLLAQINASEERFNQEGKSKMNKFVNDTKMDIQKKIDKFFDSTIDFIENDAGKCKPVYEAVYMATDAVCVSVLKPLNGFWFSIGWCLFFCIPLIILAVKLAGLYRRQFPYCDQAQYDNGTLLYHDGQADNIPLTSMEKPPNMVAPQPGMRNSGYNPDELLARHGGYYAAPPAHPHGGSYARYGYPYPFPIPQHQHPERGVKASENPDIPPPKYSWS